MTADVTLQLAVDAAAAGYRLRVDGDRFVLEGRRGTRARLTLADACATVWIAAGDAVSDEVRRAMLAPWPPSTTCGPTRQPSGGSPSASPRS